MRAILTASALALMLAASPPAMAQNAMARLGIGSAMPGSFADLVEGLLPAVVNISSTQKPKPQTEDMQPQFQFPPGSPFEDLFNDFMQQNGRNMQTAPMASLGSGFIIDADKGYIITNNHVVDGADEVRVTLHDDTVLPATVLGRDEKVDIALLQVKTDRKLTAVKFGDSSRLRVGDWVLAIGNPFGLGGTVTAGIVSAESRDINAGPYDDFIQTDASINRGNSGGPMFDTGGNVIGINTAIFSPSGGSVGIGFAVPSNLAKPVIDQLLKYGHTRRGWMGVRIQAVTADIAENLGLDGAKGALVASVTPGAPADKAGLKAGDVILQFDGKDIGAMRSLPRAVAETEIGRTVSVAYWRDGKRLETRVAIGELEKAEQSGLTDNEDETAPESAPPPGTRVGSMGMSLSPIAPQDRNNYDIPADVKGVLVTTVDPMSEAAEKSLTPGDVIVEIDRQRVTDPAKVAPMVEAARKAGKPSILLLVNRAGEVRFIALKLNRDDKAQDKPAP